MISTVLRTISGPTTARQAARCGVAKCASKAPRSCPALHEDKRVRIADALVKVIGQAAGFLAGCPDAGMACLDQPGPVGICCVEGCDDENHVSYLLLIQRCGSEMLFRAPEFTRF